MTNDTMTNDFPHTPDPGNAGVGRGNKLSVLRSRPDTEMV
ncbi:hypothetical protein SAMN05216524_10965 [Mucilaginibacter sp. OK098]|nr:hypothetical protein SAMN05216524_10965 [Mucilaginibacter sp. OK098]